jgi:hypothetical protein
MFKENIVFYDKTVFQDFNIYIYIFPTVLGNGTHKKADLRLEKGGKTAKYVQY